MPCGEQRHSDGQLSDDNSKQVLVYRKNYSFARIRYYKWSYKNTLSIALIVATAVISFMATLAGFSQGFALPAIVTAFIPGVISPEHLYGYCF